MSQTLAGVAQIFQCLAGLGDKESLPKPRYRMKNPEFLGFLTTRYDCIIWWARIVSMRTDMHSCLGLSCIISTRVAELKLDIGIAILL